jgi:hypothetical protein
MGNADAQDTPEAKAAEAAAKVEAAALAEVELKAGAEAKAKAEADAKVKAELEAKGKSEAEGKVKTEAEAKAKAEAEAKGKLPPDKYDLKLPADAKLDAQAIERVSVKARELGLSNESAQKLLETTNAEVNAFWGDKVVAYKEATDRWVGQVVDDKEIGGVEANANAELAKKVIQRFGSEELKKLLKTTGYGNHPELVRIFVRIGKTMKEDDLIPPGSQDTGKVKKDHAEILYGESVSQQS